MRIRFSKYHGAGNDFILIDNREQYFSGSVDFIKTLCHRNFGIGADGLILLEPDREYDFSMRYFNSDGKEGSLCGNGGRCITAYASDIGLIENTAIFRASDGVHQCYRYENGLYSLRMNDVSLRGKSGKSFFLNTGSPHHVEFCEDIETVDVVSSGREIRYSSEYAPEGCNVNFVSFSGDILHIRTYERGVENETLSCGTGVTAAALVAHAYRGLPSPVAIRAKGGDFLVEFTLADGKYTDIRLKGEVKKVFEGSINIQQI